MDTTAASAAGSDAPPVGPSLRATWLAAGALLAVLFAVAFAFERGREQRVLVDGPLALPPMPASDMPRNSAEPVEDAVQMTPELAIDGPTSLEIALTRDASDGSVGVDVALVNLDSLEMRELWLGLDRVPPGGAPSEAATRATALLDRVQTGRYVLRLAPRWESPTPPHPLRARGDDAPPAPPRVHLRVSTGADSHLDLALAAALIVAWPVFLTGRRLVRRR